MLPASWNPPPLPFLGVIIDMVQAKYVDVCLGAPSATGLSIGVHIDATFFK
jgi:hypothetical protein